MIDEGVPYGEKNHTMEMFYVNLDPTAQMIEYVAMFAHMMPTRVPKSHLNYEKGNHDNAQLDLEFRTTKYESPAINDVGYWYITNSKVNYNYLDFDPNIKQDGTGFMPGYTWDYTQAPTKDKKTDPKWNVRQMGDNGYPDSYQGNP